LQLPPPKLEFLRMLTDDTGILQHAKFATPRRQEGYTTDDNARALIASVRYQQLYRDSVTPQLIDIYLGFLLYMQRPDGRFHNFLSYHRQFLDEVGAEDSTGRALWALGCVMNSSVPTQERLAAKELFDKGLVWIPRFGSLRSQAFTILGLIHYRAAYPHDPNLLRTISTLADKIVYAYEHEASADWRWFEPSVTYVNGRLPHALFNAFRATSNPTYLQVAQQSFDFLVQLQTLDDAFAPIGNKGWYQRHGTRALFDQQSIEAACMTEAAVAAYDVVGDLNHRSTAYRTFEWFLGNNGRHAMVYNPVNGGCYDGITPQGLNLNQGAEATAGYLMARLTLEADQRAARVRPP
jgi:hypothetical protein